jgi:predicted hydrocarbon binding protein
MYVSMLSTPEILEKLSFVLSSHQREKVLGAVLPGPKAPAQVAKETRLCLPHVSRALAQLSEEGLVGSLSSSPRGKLYGATDLGKRVFDELTNTRGDRLVAPLALGSHLKNYYHWLVKNYGKKISDEFFQAMGINAGRIDAAGWYPLRTIVQVADAIEATFGDGSGETVRRMLRDEAREFASIRRYVYYALPFKYLAELAPAAYHREFNHGRLEVEVHGRRALFKNYDWISSPARCAAWLGTYEGVLDLVGPRRGSVKKVACILKGDPYCGYELEW